MEDHDMSDALRKGYDNTPRALEPSPLLWRRTRAALRNQGLLKSDRAPWSRRITVGLMAAGLVGFAVGWAAGRQERAPAPSAAGVSITDPFLAAAQVQQTGTAYALALETLMRSLATARVEDIALAQQVTLAASRAHAVALQRLVPGNQVGRPVPRTPPQSAPIIWF